MTRRQRPALSAGESCSAISVDLRMTKSCHSLGSYDFFNLRMSPAGDWAKQQLHDILHWEDNAGYPEDDGIRTVGSITVTGRMPKYALALQQAVGGARPVLGGQGDYNPHEFGLKNLMYIVEGFLNVADLSTWDETDTCTMSIKYNVTRCQTRDTETGPVLDMVQTSVTSALGTDLPAGCAKWFVRAGLTSPHVHLCSKPNSKHTAYCSLSTARSVE